MRLLYVSVNVNIHSRCQDGVEEGSWVGMCGHLGVLRVFLPCFFLNLFPSFLGGFVDFTRFCLHFIYF